MKRVVILLLVLVLTVIAFFASAQGSNEIVTDRPDQTESPVLVPAGGFQVETGFFLSTIKQG